MLYCSAKTRHSFTQELLDPQLQNWWHQAEDAFHRGPFQQSISRAGTGRWCYQRLGTSLRAALLWVRVSREDCSPEG